MKALIDRLHARLGDFWWYSILMFVALRFGDVINAVIGLWLVPKYVPQEELGAVLPLTQFATTFALPVSILVTIFTRYLTIFKTRGEVGKVKSLLIWMICLVIFATCMSSFVAIFSLPHLFERIRVQNGSLTILIIAAGLIGTISPVFNNALQGLKRFKTITIINLLSAPIRLATMLITLPIRALSGYMVGQIVPQIFSISATCLSLRKTITSGIKATPFWQGEGKSILKYSLLCAAWTIPGSLFAMVQALIIRQRLPEVESAAYYMISRFSEIGIYAGTTLSFMMFPLAAEAYQKKATTSLVLKTNLATCAIGLPIAGILAMTGSFLFSRIPAYNDYQPFVFDMALLSLLLIAQQLGSNYTTYESIHNRFWHMLFTLPITIIKALVLVCFTGFVYFNGILPNCYVEWMESFHLASLRNILIFLLCAQTIQNIILYACHSIRRRVLHFDFREASS